MAPHLQPRHVMIRASFGASITQAEAVALVWAAHGVPGLVAALAGCYQHLGDCTVWIADTAFYARVNASGDYKLANWPKTADGSLTFGSVRGCQRAVKTHSPPPKMVTVWRGAKNPYYFTSTPIPTVNSVAGCSSPRGSLYRTPTRTRLAPHTRTSLPPLLRC